VRVLHLGDDGVVVQGCGAQPFSTHDHRPILAHCGTSPHCLRWSSHVAFDASIAGGVAHPPSSERHECARSKPAEECVGAERPLGCFPFFATSKHPIRQFRASANAPERWSTGETGYGISVGRMSGFEQANSAHMKVPSRRYDLSNAGMRARFCARGRPSPAWPQSHRRYVRRPSPARSDPRCA
jgi:hypothetical protein